jgi:membrane protein DedA with SNARE-associated domain
MDVDQFVAQYGLVAFFLGCLLEGETVAITGGVFAHRHLLVLWQVALASGLAAFLSDMSWFLAARRFRENRWLTSIMSRAAFSRAMAAIDRTPEGFAAMLRFIPGMRIVGPVGLAQSRIPTVRFALIAAIAAMVWSVLYTIAGHAVGIAIHIVFGRVHEGEWLLLVPAAILLLLGALFLLRQRSSCRGARSSADLR